MSVPAPLVCLAEAGRVPKPALDFGVRRLLAGRLRQNAAHDCEPRQETRCRRRGREWLVSQYRLKKRG